MSCDEFHLKESIIESQIRQNNDYIKATLETSTQKQKNLKREAFRAKQKSVHCEIE